MRSPSASTSSSASAARARGATARCASWPSVETRAPRLTARTALRRPMLYDNMTTLMSEAPAYHSARATHSRPADDAIQPPAAHRRRRRPGPRAAAAPEAPVRHAARCQRHRRSRRRRGGRGGAAGRARGRGRGASHCCAGVDAVVHLGGVSVEGPFEPILQANIVGVLQPVRGGAQARRQAHRVRQLEPRHRLLSPGRGDRRRAIRCAPTATTA